MNLTIDQQSGAIHISGIDVAIGKGMSKIDASNALKPLFDRNRDHGNGYSWLCFSKVKFGLMPTSFNLCFLTDVLERITFSVALPNERLEQNWPTRESSEREVKFVRLQLNAQIQYDLTTNQTEYPWGSVYSYFDEKGFMAASGLHYS